MLADVIPYGPDLKRPQHRFVVIVGADGLYLGAVVTETDAAYRRHDSKPWTTSSSLDGRFARALVNLVPSARSVLDPCCGAGSIVLEAASLGLDAYGVDWKPAMAGITRENLAHFGYTSTVVQADSRTHHQPADAVVTDLPYGHAIDADERTIRAILERCTQLAPTGVFVAPADITLRLESAGYTDIEVSTVNKRAGFTRWVHVAQRRGRLGLKTAEARLFVVNGRVERWQHTADEVLDGLDLRGMQAVVTGSAGGIGRETAAALARVGATVWITARSARQAATVAASVAEPIDMPDVRSAELDVGSLASIRRFVAEFRSQTGYLDLLINNAGVMCTPHLQTVDGFEMQFGTNHLGHFLLTKLLAPELHAAPAARIINVSSAGHAMGDVDLVDPNYHTRPYDPFEAYGQSKTANILHVVGLQARLGGVGIDVFAVHPGAIHTELGRHMTDAVRDELTRRISEQPDHRAITWKSIPQGASTSVWAATSPELRRCGGQYCEDLELAAPVDSVAASGGGVLHRALDRFTAERVWDLSERLLAQA